ncbi:MAG: ParB/RepB/Spo0J family partition protein [Planctomycetota bacterium]|jgi:ParB family chromosome partitioning protein
MQETRNENRVKSIPIDRLIAHPGNPNRMSKRNFARLLRNIERTGRYEPLVVRWQGDCYQIINGHNRFRALRELGYKSVDAVVWDLDDNEADILLSTLNRLKGSDALKKKLTLLERINRDMETSEMAKLLPYTRSQIERLRNLKVPSAPAKAGAESFAVPMVFFLNDDQQKIIAEALASTPKSHEKTRAARNATALTEMAKRFLEKD